jgi:phytoene synthase
MKPQSTQKSLPKLARPMPARPLRVTHGFTGEASDLHACAEAIRRGSKSFHLASMMLPRQQRDAARALYAFCRHGDDLVDHPRASLASLARLRLRLERIYAGNPEPIACDRAFARTVWRYEIPLAAPAALLDGFEMDLRGRKYDTVDDVKRYASNVASSVGMMMALAMEASSLPALARAADLGIAMQLTNIARDVGEDARNGRLYLPLEWLDEAGIDAERFLASPHHSPALAGLVRRLLEVAEKHYATGFEGIALLPRGCRPAIRAAALIYRAIGNAIARNGYDSVNHRAHTSMIDKLALARQACQTTSPIGDAQGWRPDPAAAALVAACVSAKTGIQTRAYAKIPAEPSPHSIERLMLIFADLQARNSVLQSAGRATERKTIHA